MRTEQLEPETEALLLRLVPDLPSQWEGASPEEIARMEALAGRPLPRFYRWFLSRMGRAMGPLAYPTLDFSVGKILSCYEQGLLSPSRRFLLIGHESDERTPFHLFYDFDYAVRDDARVVNFDLERSSLYRNKRRRYALGGPLYIGFDTFREMLAWGEFFTSRIEKLPQQCSGLFRGSADITRHLDSIMANLRFTKPIPTGTCCALYDRPDAAMKVRATPREPPSERHFFALGAQDPGVLQRILGEIASGSSIEVEVRSWGPSAVG